MKNIERIAKYITKNGAKDIMIHTISNGGNWIICQKVDKDEWSITLSHPMGTDIHKVGTVTDKEQLILWKELAKLKIENDTAKITLEQWIRNET